VRVTDREMKDREIYAELKALPPLAVRIDGRGFRKVLAHLGFKKPYDERFARAMVGATELFFKEGGFNPQFAFTFSDEVSIFFLEMPFNSRVEKLDSIIPSFFASALTKLLGADKPLAFDSRIVHLDRDSIYRYLLWRQAEAWRNHISSYGFYILRDVGLDERAAAVRLKGMKSSDIHELAFRHGINLGETPRWQRCGMLIFREAFEKRGYDPIRGTEVTASRTKVSHDCNIPIFKSREGQELVTKLLTASLR